MAWEEAGAGGGGVGWGRQPQQQAWQRAAGSLFVSQVFVFAQLRFCHDTQGSNKLSITELKREEEGVSGGEEQGWQRGRKELQRGPAPSL